MQITFPEGGSPKADVQNQYTKKPEIKVILFSIFKDFRKKLRVI